MSGPRLARNLSLVTHGKRRPERWSATEVATRAGQRIDQAANNRVTGAVLISLGANWLLMELGLFPFGFMGLVAIALAVLGIALIGTAKAGSSPKLTVLGIVMTGILAMSSGVTNPIQGQFAGDRLVRPASLAELADNYSLVVGELTLDLSRVEFTQGIRVVSASTGLGQLEVIVPDDVALEVVASVDGAGEISLLDSPVQNGAGGVSDHYSDPDWSTAERRLHLDLDAKVGEIVVRRS